MQPRVKHRKHHFLPAGYLRAWENDDDGKLTVFHRVRGRLHADRRKAKSVAKQLGLYSFTTEHVTGDSEVLERVFFADLDEKAALVQRVLLGDDKSGLHVQDRLLFASFILSLLIRLPWEVEAVVRAAPSILKERMAMDVAAGEVWLEEAVGQEVRDESPAYFRDLALWALPEVLEGDTAHRLAGGKWQLLDLRTSRDELLIGDRPILKRGDLENEFVVCLPLGPDRALLIQHQEGSAFAGLAAWQIVARLNMATITSARRSVFGSGAELCELVDAHLTNEPLTDAA